jgi:glycosyltransferase involved in cell wall biosynthesis
MSACQVYVLISHWEGFPRSILEALRAGMPSIATNVGGVREAIIEDVTGYLVPENDSTFLATKLRALIGNPALRAEMGRAARSHYEKHFTFERLVEETLELYESVVGEAGRGPD